MKFKFIPFILPVLILASGCSMFSPEPPARSAAKAQPKKPLAKNNPPAQSVAKKPTPGSGTATYPLDSGASNFKDEGIPGFHAEPLSAPAGNTAPTAQPSAIPSPGAVLIPEPQIPTAAPASSTATTASATAVSETGDVMPVNIVMEDASIPPGTSPAVVALLGEADNSRKRGDLDTAELVTERALRIDPRNPVITYKLAQIRFRQNKFKQAEELAGKASLLSGGNLELKRKSLQLIAEARRVLRNYPNLREPKDAKDSKYPKDSKDSKDAKDSKDDKYSKYFRPFKPAPNTANSFGH